ncbi:hypothetical protein [Sphingomonas parapaucimobilis]|uniref:hypothetical protein n=1 Tax=Sphingomonas parapaucimobilis TaxID=28213 RepID=UPI0035C83F3E
MTARHIVELGGRVLPSAQRPDGHLDYTTTLNVVRGPHGEPRVEPLMRARHARITTASSIRTDYATAYPKHGRVDPIWMAGGKSLRVVEVDAPNLVPAKALGDALFELLVVVDVVLVGGGRVSVGGVAFPYLAFHEFIESLLYWPVIVGVAGPAMGAVDVVDRDMFQPAERHTELFAALLARDWAAFFLIIEHDFTDPAWALFQRSRFPGHAELFLANIRRGASEAGSPRA